jgi:hypothetical protein
MCFAINLHWSAKCSEMVWYEVAVLIGVSVLALTVDVAGFAIKFKVADGRRCKRCLKSGPKENFEAFFKQFSEQD